MMSAKSALTGLANFGQFLSPVAGLVGAGLSFLGGSKDREAQEKINQQNIEFQRAENILNRKFAREQMFGEQAFNSKEAEKLRDWQEMMYERQYQDNSLMSQVKQAMEAGVNPFGIFGNGAFNGASQPSGVAASSSASMSQGVAPRAEMIQGSYQRSFGAFSQVAMALESLSKIGLNEAQKESIMQKLQPEIDRLLAETNDKEQSAAIKEIQANLDSYFGFAERQKKLEGLNHEVESLFKKLTQQDLDISEAQFQQSLQDMRRELMSQQKRLNDNTYHQAEITLNNLQESFTSLFRLRYAQEKAAAASSVASYASAEQSKASAANLRADTQTKEESRPFVIGNLANSFEQGQVKTVDDAVKLANFIDMAPDLHEKLRKELQQMDQSRAIQQMEMLCKFLDQMPKGFKVTLPILGSFGFNIQ